MSFLDVPHFPTKTSTWHVVGELLPAMFQPRSPKSAKPQQWGCWPSRKQLVEPAARGLSGTLESLRSNLSQQKWDSLRYTYVRVYIYVCVCVCVCKTVNIVSYYVCISYYIVYYVCISYIMFVYHIYIYI